MAVTTDFDPSFTINFVNAAMVAGTTSTYTTTVTTAGILNGKFVTTLAAQTNTASEFQNVRKVNEETAALRQTMNNKLFARLQKSHALEL